MIQNLISNEISDNIINIDNDKNKDLPNLLNIDNEDQANNFDNKYIFNNIDFKTKDINKYCKHQIQFNNDKNNEDRIISNFDSTSTSSSTSSCSSSSIISSSSLSPNTSYLSSSSDLSSHLSNPFYSIIPTNDNWIILEKQYLKSENNWKKNRELLEKKFIEEFGSPEGCLLPNNSRWFQFKVKTYISIQLEWWSKEPKHIEQNFEFTLFRKACLLHSPTDFNFKPNHDLPLIIAIRPKEGNIFWQSMFRRLNLQFDGFQKVKDEDALSCFSAYFIMDGYRVGRN
jgi:hypothetical protein